MSIVVAHSQEETDAANVLKEKNISFNTHLLENFSKLKKIDTCYIYLKKPVMKQELYISYLYLISKELIIIPAFKKVGFLRFIQAYFRVIIEAVISPLLVIAVFLFLIILYQYTKKLRSNRFRLIHNAQLERNSKNVIYIRSDSWILFGKEGGCVSHMKGIIKAFEKLGYKISYWGIDKIGVQPFIRNIPEVSEIFYNFYFLLKFKYKNEDFIYSRLGLNDFKSLLLSIIYKIPYFIEFNGSEVTMAKKWWRPLKLEFFTKLCEMLVLKNAYKVSSISKVALNEALSYKSNAILIPNGFDEDEFKSNLQKNYKKILNAEDKILITLISTFEYYHGADILAEAIKYVINKHKNVLFVFVGSGMRKNIVREIINKDKVSDYVIFTGILPHKDVIDLLKSSDILVSPHRKNPDGSEFVGSPTKIFEYMAAGKAIVVSKLGQMQELFKDNVNALLVEPDNPYDLAEKIIKLIEDENLRNKLGKAALQEASKYTWKNNLKKLLGFV